MVCIVCEGISMATMHDTDMFFVVLQGHGLELLQWFMSVFPLSTPTVMRALMWTGVAFPDHSRISESWNLLHIPYYIPRHAESEVVVHFDDAAFALQDLLELVETKGIGVSFIVEV